MAYALHRLSKVNQSEHVTPSTSRSGSIAYHPLVADTGASYAKERNDIDTLPPSRSEVAISIVVLVKLLTYSQGLPRTESGTDLDFSSSTLPPIFGTESSVRTDKSDISSAVNRLQVAYNPHQGQEEYYQVT